MISRFTSKDVAKVILWAVKYREESYDNEAAEKASNKDMYVDYAEFYRKTILEATEEACEKTGVDINMTFIIDLGLDYCWNDLQEWAEWTLTPGNEEKVYHQML